MSNGDPDSPGLPTSVDSEPACDDSAQGSAGSIVIDSDQPTPKRYAHYGKRRRSFTEELFRCKYVDKISRTDLVCNSLLWRDRQPELRAHLLEHLAIDKVSAMSDDEVRSWYHEAKRIFLEAIPEDEDPDNIEEGEDEDDYPEEE